MNKSVIFCLLLLASANAVHAQNSTFSNNTGAAHNTWDTGNNWGTALTRTITVSGLPATLSSGGTVLKQINIRMGNGVNTGLNLSTFAMRITSPSGTVISICTAGEFSSTSIRDVNIKYRDHATLKRVADLPSGTPSAAWPYHIGYYRVSSAGSFANVNGENPNGNWTFQIIEGTSTEIAFSGVDLIFGPPFNIVDISSSSTNDACTGAQCIQSNNTVYICTNNGYQNPGPATDPGLTIGGCSWNGAKNNTAWFTFTASGTTATITLSGFSNMQQSIGLSMSGGCNSPTYTVPSGGCPNDAANNQYGGGATHGSSGMSYNHELNFSGLTAGNTYYVVIDGTGGNISPFYLELISGGIDCPGPLPVSLISFTGTAVEEGNRLEWAAASEINNAYYTLERSWDMIQFEEAVRLPGAGNSNDLQNYMWIDTEPGVLLSSQYVYYRLKQTDFDGTIHYEGQLIALRHGTSANLPYVTFADPTQISFHLGDGITVQEGSITLYSLQGDMITEIHLPPGTYTEIAIPGTFARSLMIARIMLNGTTYCVKMRIE